MYPNRSPSPSEQVKLQVAQLCPTLSNPMDPVHGISQPRMLEWVAILFSRGIFPTREQTRVSCTASRLFTA